MTAIVTGDDEFTNLDDVAEPDEQELLELERELEEDNFWADDDRTYGGWDEEDYEYEDV